MSKKTYMLLTEGEVQGVLTWRGQAATGQPLHVETGQPNFTPTGRFYFWPMGMQPDETLLGKGAGSGPIMDLIADRDITRAAEKFLQYFEANSTTNPPKRKVS